MSRYLKLAVDRRRLYGKIPFKIQDWNETKVNSKQSKNLLVK